MASPLEHFVNQVRILSQNGNFRELCDFLSKSQELLHRSGPHLDTVLETLDIQQHSLGILVVLCSKYAIPPNTVSGESTAMFEQIQEFILNCNGEQIRLSPDYFAELCHLLTNHLVTTKQPLKGISLIKKAIRKIQLFDSQLTSIHADLCQLCLLSKCMKPALEFLDTDITGISLENGHYDAKHFLLYYYYGGMIYTAVKNYDRALYYFEVAITTPAIAVSHIMLEAYKKYILISLILHGKIPAVPKYTSQVVGRFLKPLSSAYHELAGTQTATSAQLVLQKHRDTFGRDYNIGLVNQVISSMYKKNIQRLTKTFLTLSLTDVASRVQLTGPQQAESYLLNMIEDGEIYAVINQKDGMVVFLDSPEKYASPETLFLIEKQMENCTRLHQHVQDMDQQIQVNPQYVKKSMGSQDDDIPGSIQSPKTTYSM